MNLSHGYHNFIVRLIDTSRPRLSDDYSNQLVAHYQDLLAPCLRSLLLAGHVPQITRENVVFSFSQREGSSDRPNTDSGGPSSPEKASPRPSGAIQQCSKTTIPS